MKTARRWFKLLPVKERYLAYKYTPQKELNRVYDSLEQAISKSFLWSATKEGVQYWVEVSKKAWMNEHKTDNSGAGETAGGGENKGV